MPCLNLTLSCGGLEKTDLNKGNPSVRASLLQGTCLIVERIPLATEFAAQYTGDAGETGTQQIRLLGSGVAAGGDDTVTPSSSANNGAPWASIREEGKGLSGSRGSEG